MKFSSKDFFSKYDQIHKKQRIWSHLLNKYLIQNFFFLCSDIYIIGYPLPKNSRGFVNLFSLKRAMMR